MTVKLQLGKGREDPIRIEVDIRRLIHALENAISSKEAKTPEGRERLRSYVRTLRDLIADLAPLSHAVESMRRASRMAELGALQPSSGSTAKTSSPWTLGSSLGAIKGLIGGGKRGSAGIAASSPHPDKAAERPGRAVAGGDGATAEGGTQGRDGGGHHEEPDPAAVAATGPQHFHPSVANDASATPALHQSCLEDDPELTASLLSTGHRALDRDPLGRTALHVAALSGSRGCARAILAVSTAGDSALAAGDARGRTPLHEAAAAGDERMVATLLGMSDRVGEGGGGGGDGDLEGSSGPRGSQKDAGADDDGASPGWGAWDIDDDIDDVDDVKKGDSGDVGDDSGNDGGDRDGDGKHAGTRAVSRAVLDVRDDGGCTAMHAALYHGHPRIAKILARSGASQDIPDAHGMTASQLVDLAARIPGASGPLNAIGAPASSAIDAAAADDVATMADVAAFASKVDFLAGLIEEVPVLSGGRNGAAAVPGAGGGDGLGRRHWLGSSSQGAPGLRSPGGLGAAGSAAAAAAAASAAAAAAATAVAAAAGSGSGSASPGASGSAGMLSDASAGRAALSAAGERERTGRDMLVAKTIERVEESERESLFGGLKRRRPAARDADTGGASLGSSDAASALADAKAEQDRLAQDLSEMTRSLKEHATSIRDRLREDVTVLEDADNVVDANVDLMGATGQRLKERLRATSRNTLSMWLVIILVVFLFFATFLFIKLFPKRAR